MRRDSADVFIPLVPVIGAPQLCPSNAQIKVQSVIYPPPVIVFGVLPLQIDVRSKQTQKFGFIGSTLLDQHLWWRHSEGKRLLLWDLFNLQIHTNLKETDGKQSWTTGSILQRRWHFFLVWFDFLDKTSECHHFKWCPRVWLNWSFSSGVPQWVCLDWTR